MNTYDIVHLLLYAAGGTVQGRTKLQKLVYFATALSGLPESLGYRAHYFGPYSPEVAGAVDDLRSLRFLDQHVTASGNVDPNGFEVARYDYTLTDEGKQIAEEKAKEHPAEWERIKAAFEKIRQSGEENYVKLSIAAKAYFLCKSKWEKQMPAKEKELLDSMPEFGWKVTREQLKEAFKLLSLLGLIRIVPASGSKKRKKAR